MKQIVKVILLMAAAFIMASCQKEQLEKMPEMKLSKQEVSIDGDGGTLTITYSIVNPAEGGTVKGSSEASWISGIDCSTANVVKMTIAPNPEKEEREATVNLTYTAAGNVNAAVTVRQAAGENSTAEDAPFTVSVFNIENETAVAGYEPQDKTMTYAALCVTAEEYESHESDEEFFDSIIDLCWSEATDIGLPL